MVYVRYKSEVLVEDLGDYFKKYPIFEGDLNFEDLRNIFNI